MNVFENILYTTRTAILAVFFILHHVNTDANIETALADVCRAVSD